MNITVVLAQIFGILFVVLGVSMVVNKKGAAAALVEFGQNQGFLWLAGLIALVMGAVLVTLSNVWMSGLLALVVTIIGWLVLVKGIFILWFQNAAAKLYGKYTTSKLLIWWGIVIFVIGLVLLYKGLWG
jgi:drug/metabolite transporter (DMT)-like permease